MAITVDWPTKIINVPRNDMILLQSVPTEIRELDVNTFRLILKDLEDDVEGMPWLDTHRHVAPISVGGVTLARVVEIINGYTVTFEDGQYAVNLKGANTNLADVTNVNQVSVRSSNSAGLQDLSTLLASAYQDVVVVDTIDGQAGTDTPIGTRSTPVNNMADAKTIADRLGIRTFQLHNSLTLSNGDYSEGYNFRGDNPVTVSVNLQLGANLENCEFNNLTVSGVLDAYTVIRECSVYDISYFDGFLWQSALNGTITVTNGAQATIAECFSNIAGGNPNQLAKIDMGGSGSLALREYNGGLNISNFNGGGAISMDFNAGRLVVEDSVTSGNLYVRGNCDIYDNTTGSAVIYDQTVQGDLRVINSGVQKASLLIPHTDNLS